MNFQDSIKSFFEVQSNSIDFYLKNYSEIIKICKVLTKAKTKEKQIFIIGNGGSGSTASHFASDLSKTAILKNEKRFKSISLLDNVPVITAWSNDVSYDDIFVEQLKNLFSKGDMLVAFSGSGNSINVIKALQFAKKSGGYCISFTGKSGGKMKNFSDICLKSPTNDMLSIEAQHVIICHCIISAIRNSGTPIFKYD